MSRPTTHLSRGSHSAASSFSSRPDGSPASTWTVSTDFPSTSAGNVASPLAYVVEGQASAHFRTQSSSSARLGHCRASSAASIPETPTPFPDLESPTESVLAPLPVSKLELAPPRSGTMSGAANIKMRARHRRGSRGTGSLDLSKSRAENEDMGAYTGLESHGLSSPSATRVHQRAGSVVSQASAASSLSARLGSEQFIHPMRQTPQSFTPLARPLRAASVEHHEIENEENPLGGANSPLTSLAHPSSPLSPRRMSTAVRTVASSRSTSQTNLKLVSPTDSLGSPELFSAQSTPPTGRSSFDSMAFGKKAVHDPADPAEFAATVQQMRAEAFEKQRIKDDKLAAKEAKAREKQLRKQEARERKVTSRRGSKGGSSSDSDLHRPSQHPESPVSDLEMESEGVSSFPAFVHHEQAVPNANDAPPARRGLTPSDPEWHFPAGFLSSSDGRCSTPEAYRNPPPVKRATRAASNTWNRLTFDVATLRIHVMRSVGLRQRE